MLAKLATSDGGVSKDEVTLLESFISDILKLNDAQKVNARKIFNQACKANISFEDHAKRYKELLSNQPKMLEWMIDVLLQIACGDKVLQEREEKLIENAAYLFGLSKGQYLTLKDRYQPTKINTHAYQVLKSDMKDATEVIVANYHKLKSDYDPAKMIELGLPDEFIETAKKRAQEIEAAFKVISNERGI